VESIDMEEKAFAASCFVGLECDAGLTGREATEKESSESLTDGVFTPSSSSQEASVHASVETSETAPPFTLQSSEEEEHSQSVHKRTDAGTDFKRRVAHTNGLDNVMKVCLTMGTNMLSSD
jgi:hypothetical protein